MDKTPLTRVTRRRLAGKIGAQSAQGRRLWLVAGLLGALAILGTGCSDKPLPNELSAALPLSGGAPVTQPVQATARPTPLPPAKLAELPTPTIAVSAEALNVVALAPDGQVSEPEAPASQPDAPALYTVEAGDTLLGIAMAFDVPMAALQLVNGLGTTTLVRVDQILEIPVGQGWAGASSFWVVHQVEAGETLGEIAALNGLSLAELLAANNGVDADRIAIGQALVLPLRGPQQMLAKAPAAAPATVAPTATPAPVAAAQSEPAPVEPAVAGPTPTAGPLEPAPAPPADVAALPAQIFRLLNVERATYGLPPLTWNGTLARAAQLHADDCFARGWCSHTGSDGSTYKQRMIREGYDPVRWSECWAWYGSAERAVAMWMDEAPPNDPHRRTILNEALTEVGVGVVPGNGFGYYFIADFGTPR